ncbi:thermonuclease family protein [Modestobacter sp. VKM Ac-2977]|uniref:thermonuclease family protein n=1 Tax=Modestobacter sp. VKM Ac-2977 TaxID=3004131 RepID=UPI0022AA7983|nr:thermonuclease family protein [Modestobacter sp. VKM Ac-2977]MCZ2821044.1 thermonuclease family protein [Modestobacter sp. VKM Ac-2977]
MQSLFAVVATHKIAATVTAAALVVGAGAVHEAVSGPVTATVTKVVDGDTIDVRYDGETRRVRLLNVDTPESVDPSKPVECLAPEATQYLKGRLPVGTEVRLEHDEEKYDRYGRELAAVFLGDDLVNADIARQGLGVALVVGSNTQFYPPVRQAHDEAREAGRGLYASDVTCTVPAQVAALEQTAADTVAEQPVAPTELAAFDFHSGELVAALTTARALTALLDRDPRAFPLLPFAGRGLSGLQSRVERVRTDLDAAVADNDSARVAEQQRQEEEARRAAEEAARQAAEEAARQAAEEAARKAAEEEAARKAAEEAAAAATRARAQSPSSSRISSSAPRTAAPPQTSGSSNPSGYTGCRSYAPGGKSWTPMPCPGS